MQYLHGIIDWLFARYPALKEFCFLSLPLAFCEGGTDGLFNAQAWHDFLTTHPTPLSLLPSGLDHVSRRNAKTLVNRRKTLRYFLHLPEILQYYRAKHLTIPYWFPNDGTLLKSVFLCKAGFVHIPNQYRSTINDRVAIDGGAASGDSSIVLVKCGARQVLAFEPSPRQREEMTTVFERNNLSDRIKIVPFAIGDGIGKLSFNDQYGEHFETPTVTIDNYCQNMDVGCIKLDIEGAEFPSIRNAEKTIERCHPILIICAYHRPEDLFEMPRWLQNRFPFYKFVLRDTESGNRLVGCHLCLIGWPTDIPQNHA